MTNQKAEIVFTRSLLFVKRGKQLILRSISCSYKYNIGCWNTNIRV